MSESPEERRNRRKKGWGRAFWARARQARRWSWRALPPGVRLLVGLLLMIGGVLGFLPVVGFWMLPLGVAVAAPDVLPLWRIVRRWWKGRKDDSKDT
ncbi:hypothetical protein [Salinihabitans flavidus]|nr:hypothetical protein [Salinihabitans flavidus]